MPEDRLCSRDYRLSVSPLERTRRFTEGPGIKAQPPPRCLFTRKYAQRRQPRASARRDWKKFEPLLYSGLSLSLSAHLFLPLRLAPALSRSLLPGPFLSAGFVWLSMVRRHKRARGPCEIPDIVDPSGGLATPGAQERGPASLRVPSREDRLM